MSQHCIETLHDGRAVLVQMGYDKPLNYVFLVVELVEPTDDDDSEGLVYSNLSDEVAGIQCQDVNYYRSVLSRLQITVPRSMFDEVIRDQHARVGNRSVDYCVDGSYTERV